MRNPAKYQQFVAGVFSMVGLLASGLSAGAAPQTFTAYKGATPTIDGTLSPGEWSDAAFINGLSGWKEECRVANNAADLSLTCYIKHDDTCLYFAYDVTDNIIYGVDTPRWVGAGSDSATVHKLDSTGWAWYGDGVELMIDAANASSMSGPAGNGSSWKMVCSTHKSRLYGFASGGLLEGAPASALSAYQTWITTQAMKAAVRLKPASEGRGYVIEWKIRGNPCLQIGNGQFWSGSSGARTMGMNLEIEDLDQLADSAGWMGFRHIANWIGGNKELMSEWGSLVIDPGNNPSNAARDKPASAPGQFSISGNRMSIRGSLDYRIALQDTRGRTVCRFDGRGGAHYSIPEKLPAGSYLVTGAIDGKKIETSTAIVR